LFRERIERLMWLSLNCPKDREMSKEWCQKVNSLKNEIDRYLRCFGVSIFLLVSFWSRCKPDFLLCEILLFLSKRQQAQKQTSETQ